MDSAEGIDHIRKNFTYETGEDIIGYAKRFGLFLHEGVFRLTGEPYSKHLQEVSETAPSIIKDSEYLHAVRGAGWLHDGPEDHGLLDVYNPYNAPSKDDRNPDKVYLNELVYNAHEQGEHLCYLVDRMTYRGGIYFEYMENKFRFTNDGKGVIHDLDILSAILKMIDRRFNSRYGEVLEMDEIVNTYQQLKNAPEEDRISFYRHYKIINMFKEHGSYAYNMSLMVKSLQQRFDEKIEANALDNLLIYIPKAETKLLVPYFQEESPLFSYDSLRAFLKLMFVEQIMILEKSHPNMINTMRKAGYNRGNEGVFGYTSLRKEVKRDMFPEPAGQQGIQQTG